VVLWDEAPRARMHCWNESKSLNDHVRLTARFCLRIAVRNARVGTGGKGHVWFWGHFRRTPSYLVLVQVSHAALMNCALNGIIAWFIFRARSSIPVWGDGGLVFDTIAHALPVAVLDVPDP